MKVTSTEFQQNVGRYQDAAQTGPIEISENGRVHSVLMSATFFELVMKGRVSRSVEDLEEGTLEAITKSNVPPEFAPLDDLIKHWNP